jgi:hypothetical protein
MLENNRRLEEAEREHREEAARVAEH